MSEEKSGQAKEKKEAAEKVKEAELEALKEELAAKKAQAEEYLDTLKRLKAEFENYKKRILKEQTQFLELASQNLIAKLLPVLDNFELALFAAEETTDYENPEVLREKLLRGIEMVYGEFKDLLYKEGLMAVEAEGKEFNPEVHEAVMQVHSEKHEDNTVVDVLRQGYIFKGRLIRPALVKVAKK